MRRHLTHMKDAAGGNITGDSQHPCRSTVQGPVLAADEEGYVCLLRDIAASGCCRAEAREPQVTDTLPIVPMVWPRVRRPFPPSWPTSAPSPPPPSTLVAAAGTAIAANNLSFASHAA